MAGRLAPLTRASSKVSWAGSRPNVRGAFFVFFVRGLPIYGIIRFMSKKSDVTQATVHGEIVASVGGRFVLVKTGKASVVVKVPAGESAKLLKAA